MHNEELLKKAMEARGCAYAPYSKFRVGAALLSQDGCLFTGSNVENASYGLSICAERTAVFKAVSEGVTQFSAIAVSVPSGGPPCGACRQVLAEFNERMIVLIGDENGHLVDQTTVFDLLPSSFRGENLR